MMDYKNIPDEMKSLRRWVLWKNKESEKGKTTKVPINANNGYGAKTNDSSTWVSFEEAVDSISYYNCKGIGFVLGDGYFGVDIDNHADDNGVYPLSDEQYEKLTGEFVKTLCSYSETSQSGKGIHIICKGVLPEGSRHKGCVEMYDNKRFFAMTGNLCSEYKDVKECTDLIKPLFNKYLGSQKNCDENSTYVYRKDRKNSSVSGILSDEEVISKACSSRNGSLFSCLYYGQWEGLGYPSQSEADGALCSMLAFWCGKDRNQMNRVFCSSKLIREKWYEMRGDKTYGEMTIDSAIRNCKDVYSPAFTNSSEFDPKTGSVVSVKSYELNDTGNAKRFIDRFGQSVRYNFDMKRWIVYDGKSWVRDEKQIVKKQADIMIDEMKKEAILETDKSKQSEMLKNIKHLSSNNGKEAMLKEAMHIGETATINSDYDKNDYLLNCENGVVDLRTGEIYSHDKKYMMSKNTHVFCDMKNQPKLWIKFLEDVFKKDKEMIEYIQKAIGYTLTGDTKEQCYFQCYGDGSNGKSVLFDVIYKMFGDYAQNTQIEAILSKGNGNSGASSEIARMDKMRFVRTNEPNEGSRFNEGLLKQIVGGDVVTARFLYANEFEFIPKCKLWIATNYKINIRGTDTGIWRRTRLIPFEVKFEGNKVDKHLTEKLMNELPQILGWCVRGSIMWQKEGLKTPRVIEIANGQYREEMDIIETFLKDNAKITPVGREKAGNVYRAYSNWAKQGKEYCMSQTRFGKEMAKRYKKVVINGYSYYEGFILKENDKSYVYIKEQD